MKIRKILSTGTVGEVANISFDLVVNVPHLRIIHMEIGRSDFMFTLPEEPKQKTYERGADDQTGYGSDHAPRIVPRRIS